MSTYALLFEGLTERIYFDNLLPYIQRPDKLFCSTNLVKVLDDNIHENKIWMVNCSGDRSIPTYIKKNARAFIKNDFSKIILIRDYFPDNKQPTNLCKKELCKSILSNIPTDVINKYNDNIFINLSVEEVEAWYFADKGLWTRINSCLTDNYINDTFNDILSMNPEQIRHPSIIFDKIIRSVGNNIRYRKHENEIHFVVSKINFGNTIDAVCETNVQSLFRIIQYLMDVL